MHKNHNIKGTAGNIGAYIAQWKSAGLPCEWTEVALAVEGVSMCLIPLSQRRKINEFLKIIIS